MARRSDKTRVLRAQLAGSQRRLDDLNLAIDTGRADPSQREPVLERIAELEAAIAQRTGQSP